MGFHSPTFLVIDQDVEDFVRMGDYDREMTLDMVK
jgi:hypothetical protein